jgi:hypothetical protein
LRAWIPGLSSKLSRAASLGSRARPRLSFLAYPPGGQKLIVVESGPATAGARIGQYIYVEYIRRTDTVCG